VRLDPAHGLLGAHRSARSPYQGQALTGLMKDIDKKVLREAAAQVENANSRVLEVIGMAVDRRDLPDHMPQEELVALRGIASNLRSACTRMWEHGRLRGGRSRTWTELIHRVYAGCLASGRLAPFQWQVHRLDRIFTCRERSCRPVPG
jgi:hypothetical protein